MATKAERLAQAYLRGPSSDSVKAANSLSLNGSDGTIWATVYASNMAVEIEKLLLRPNEAVHIAKWILEMFSEEAPSE